MKSIHEIFRIKKRTDYSSSYLVFLYSTLYSLKEVGKLWRNYDNRLSYLVWTVDQRASEFFTLAQSDLEWLTRGNEINEFNFLTFSCDTTENYYA